MVRTCWQAPKSRLATVGCSTWHCMSPHLGCARQHVTRHRQLPHQWSSQSWAFGMIAIDNIQLEGINILYVHALPHNSLVTIYTCLFLPWQVPYSRSILCICILFLYLHFPSKQIYLLPTMILEFIWFHTCFDVDGITSCTMQTCLMSQFPSWHQNKVPAAGV